MTGRLPLLWILSAAAMLGDQMPRFPSDAGLPPVLPIPPLISPSVHPPPVRGGGGRGFFPFFPGLNTGYPLYQPPVSVSNVVVVQPAAPPAPPPLPEKPPRSELREYSWPASPPAAPRHFSIVLRDGSVHAARVLWLSGPTLFFITPEGLQREIPLDSVDRPATGRRNRESSLPFPWP